MKVAIKKFLVLLFACSYFLSVTGLIELSKLPMLTAHYQESKRNDAGLSFLEFLTMHYMTDDNNAGDNEQDNRLPFKSANSCFTSISVCLPQSAIAFITKPVAISSDQLPDGAQTLNGINFPDLVWNPPKAA